MDQQRKMKSELSGREPTGAARSDAELVQAARRGDKRAFVEIVARHQAMVTGVALGVLGDFGASEDAGQEAFLIAWRKLDELREPEKLRGWLGQIARNAALGQLRRTREHTTLDDQIPLADESPTPDQAAASEEEAVIVREMLAKLPELYRLPLVLYYREGHSVHAVADALGVSDDCVKQRLARGREMLQQRMSSLLETVLTRTRPNAVFTMTIAAAIGALAAPAALAGPIVGTASSAAASMAADSAPSVVALMSTSKAIIIAAAVVAVTCVPIGYELELRKRDVPPQPSLNEHAEQPAVAEPAAGSPTFEHSPLFAEWRKLHEKHGTNAQAMPVLYKAIADLPVPFHRQAFRTALIAEWAEVDPAGGLQFFFGKGPDEAQRRQFVEEWLARDAEAAVNALLTSGADLTKLPGECLTNIARLAPSKLPELASRLPKPDYPWETGVRDAFAVVASGDLSAALKAAETVTGPNRSEALAGVAQVWARGDLQKVLDWATTLPEGTDRDEIRRAALIGRAGVDPAAALDSVDLVPAGGRHAFFASTTGARVLKEAAVADFNATVGWVAAHPGALSREELYGLAPEVTERLNRDAAGFLSAHAADGTLAALVPAIGSALLNEAAGQRSDIWDWLKSQPETEATKAIQTEILRTAGYQDPKLALQLVADLPQSSAGDAQVREVARCLFNGGMMLNRFDRLWSEAPERLRQPLVEEAFAFLGAESLDSPQRWVSRLSLLPESSRPRAVEDLARAWGQHTPEEALAWENSLPPGDARNRAARGIISSWGAKDMQGAAEYVASLPPGTERDYSARGLVSALADQHPREAWEWAVSITDAAERKSAAAQAATAMAAIDPAIAREWLATGPFTAEAKAELLSRLEKSKEGPR